MTDIQKLKALAEAATSGEWRYGPGDGEDESPIVFVDLPQSSSDAISVLFEGDWATDADAKFVSIANPAAVLELIAEIESLKSCLEMESAELAWSDSDGRAIQVERDLLKADNEALRKDAERYRWLRAETGLGPNIQVSEWVGPHEYRLHGEELDIAIDGALSKEARHD